MHEVSSSYSSFDVLYIRTVNTPLSENWYYHRVANLPQKATGNLAVNRTVGRYNCSQTIIHLPLACTSCRDFHNLAAQAPFFKT